MQIINLLVLTGGIIGGGVSFYYKANDTADKVDDLTAALKEEGEKISDALTGIDQRIDSVQTDVNVIRTEVVKIAAESNGQQRQIDDLKDRIP